VGANFADAAAILERITATLESDPPALGEVRASFGVARAPDDGSTRDELVAAADRRLYDHKRRRQIHVLPRRTESS